MATYLDTRGDTLSLRDVAYTSQVGRDEMSERLAVVANSMDELRAKLRAFATGEDAAIASVQENPDLEALGQAWEDGDEVDWQRLHADTMPRRISLPPYPFKRKRYWVK